MEDIFYNILWIDDEHETLSGTKGRAKRNGINLIPYKSLDGGMSELERNYPFYDGVLLDAKFFENEDDEAGSEDTYASFRAKDRILQLPKKFEIFILTGQAEAYENRTFKKAFTKVYEKGKDEDVNLLFSDIKEAAKGQHDTQLRYSFKRVFDLCTERYVGELAGQDLLYLLKVTDESDIDNDFNTIRKIVEDLFTAFHKYNLLPIEFVSPGVALNESSKFLAGKSSEGLLFTEKGFQHLEETHLPQQVASYIRSILSITQAGSHRSNIDKFVKQVRTPYLFKSVLYQLMDVLVWFKMYVDGNPKTENWQRTEDVISKVDAEPADLTEGKVINMNIDKGFAFFQPDAGGSNIFVPPHLVTANSLTNGLPISVEIEEYVDNRSGETKNRVKRIEQLS
jgi:cold shock CspA family protein